MPARPVVPLSFEKPVPASQARSKAQLLVDGSRQAVTREVINAGRREFASELAQAEAKLREALRFLSVPRPGQPWTPADTQTASWLVGKALAGVEPKLAELLTRNAGAARALGASSVTDVIALYEGKKASGRRPLTAGQPAPASPAEAERHRALAKKSSAQAERMVQARLEADVRAGKSPEEIARRLAGARGVPGALLEHRAAAERTIRTEAMRAMAEGAQAEMVALQAQRYPDLRRKLIETFDQKTGRDSREAHGQVRALDEEFVDGAGRRYLLPPGRPNDRGVVIPWRTAWEKGQPQVRPGADESVPSGASSPAAPPDAVGWRPPAAGAFHERMRQGEAAPAPADRGNFLGKEPASAGSSPPRKPPPAPPAAAAAPAGPTRRQRWAQELLDALAANNEGEIRRVLMNTLAAAGLTSTDEMQGRSERHRYEVRPRAKMPNGVNGSHQWNGRIVIAEDVHLAAMAGLRHIASGGRVREANPRLISAIRSLLHEAAHGTSLISPAAYSDKEGIGFEEATNDYVARYALRRALRVQSPLAGPINWPTVSKRTGTYVLPRNQSAGGRTPFPYEAEMLTLTEVVRRHLPAVAPGDIPGHIEAAVIKSRSKATPNGPLYRTAREHMLEVGHGLGLRGPELQAFVNEAILRFKDL